MPNLDDIQTLFVAELVSEFDLFKIGEDDEESGIREGDYGVAVENGKRLECWFSFDDMDHSDRTDELYNYFMLPPQLGAKFMHSCKLAGFDNEDDIFYGWLADRITNLIE